MNQEKINQIREEQSFEGYTPSNYEIAASYLQQLNGRERLELIDSLAPFKSGEGALNRMRRATKALAKQI